MDTIFALSTAPGKAGIAVIRVSGPQAFVAGVMLAGSLPPAHVARLRKLRSNGEVLDEGLVLVFPAAASFTGEDVVELHLHGSVAIVSVVLAVLGRQSGLREADPGEFTRRALENGRLDLTQVEGLSDLLAAETEAQRRQAMRGMSGELALLAERWRARFIRAAALIEASLDFADEPVPVDVRPEVLEILRELCADMTAELERFPAAERVRGGFEVAIVGAPNVGKSTLLNRLAGREAAITSEFAGTTRDVIEVRMDIGGLPVTLLDTAGVRDTSDPVEALGIARALDRARTADLRVFLVLEEGLPDGFAVAAGDIVVRAKADSGGGVSGRTGAGVDALLQRISDVLGARVAGAPLLTRERHRVLVAGGLDRIARAISLVSDDDKGLELAAEHLRVVIHHLEALVGRVDVESVLGEIFASFCIGK